MKATKKKDAKVTSTLGALISHPTRVQCYVILNERIASPNELAMAISETVGHVSYHVDKMKGLGVIELVRTKPVRGAIEHFYRAVERPVALEKGLEEMTPAERDWLTNYILQLAVTDAALSIDDGTFNRRLNNAIVRVPLTVDEEGFAELHKLHEGTYAGELEIEAASAARMAANGTEPIPVVAVNWFHETASTRVR